MRARDVARRVAIIAYGWSGVAAVGWGLYLVHPALACVGVGGWVMFDAWRMAAADPGEPQEETEHVQSGETANASDDAAA